MVYRSKHMTLLLIGLFGWGCASAGGSGSLACTSDLLASVSPLNEVLDSASAHGLVHAFWPPGTGLVVAQMGGVSDGQPDSLRVWSETLTDQQKAELQRIVRSAARELPRGTAPVPIFIGDKDGPSLRRLDRLAMCAPVVLNKSVLEDRIAAEAEGLDIEDRSVVQVAVFVARSGLIGEVRVQESSGDVNLDLAAARVFRGVRFKPALVEGMAVPVWAAFPITIAPR